MVREIQDITVPRLPRKIEQETTVCRSNGQVHPEGAGESPCAGVLELGAGVGFGLSVGEFPMTKTRKKMVKSRRENEVLMLETIFNVAAELERSMVFVQQVFVVYA